MFPLAMRFLLTSLSAVCFPYTSYLSTFSGLPGARAKDPAPLPLPPHLHRCCDRPRTFPPLIAGRDKLLVILIVTALKSQEQPRSVILHSGLLPGNLLAADDAPNTRIKLELSESLGSSHPLFPSASVNVAIGISEGFVCRILGLWIGLCGVLVFLSDLACSATSSSKRTEHRRFSSFDRTGPVVEIPDAGAAVVASLRKAPRGGCIV